MTIVELFSKRFYMNGIDTPSLCDKLDNNNNDNWYVFLVHIVQSLASECMAHVNILIAGCYVHVITGLPTLKVLL